MVTVTYRKKGIRLKHVWFADTQELTRLISGGSADLLFAHGVQVPPQKRQVAF